MESRAGVNARQYRALVLDDEQEWRDLLTEILEDVGFRVTVAASIHEVRQRALESFYHLVILDISMRLGPDNREGLDFFAELREAAHRSAMVVIVVSGYIDRLRQREAFSKYKAADVIAKQEFEDEEFIPLVLAKLREDLPINLELKVIWRPGDSDGGALLNMNVRGTRVKRDEANAEFYQRLREELDDLIARTFHDAETVVISPMTAGKSGAAVARVEPVYGNGGGRPIVMKFGDVHDIHTESDKYRHFVQPYLGGGRSTAVQSTTYSWVLGSLCYTFLGADEFENFGSFYRRASVHEIEQTVEQLFQSTCSGWYANAGRLVARDLGEEYRRNFVWTEERLTKALTRNLTSVQGKDRLHFQALPHHESIRNPVPMLLRESFAYPTYFCTTHGDLNESNIFVDGSGACWLIDFLQTGEGHILRDFVLLDTAVRCTLINPQEATLQERYAMETALLASRTMDAAGQLTGELQSDNAALQKAFAISKRIRSLAAKQVRARSMVDLPDYRIATAFCSLNLIRFLHLPTICREQGLLAAALNMESLRA